MTYFSMSAFRNDPVTSTIDTSILSNASMVDVMSMYSNVTAGDIMSDFVDSSHYFRKSAHVLPFIVPSLFCFRNIIHSIARFFLSPVSIVASCSAKVSFVCSCNNSFDMASSALTLNFF
jgi:hypothetical protein